MITKKNCECVQSAIHAVAIGSTLASRGREFKKRYKAGERNIDMEEESFVLKTDTNIFEGRCDISKLGNRLDQFKEGVQRLNDFLENHDDIDSAIIAGSSISTAIRDRFVGKGNIGLIECDIEPGQY